MRNLVGMQIKQFKFEELLGMGGTSVVYKVLQVPEEKNFVIKLLANHWLNNEKQVQKFISEGKLLISLNHPNIVNVLETGQLYGQNYQLMEYVSGISLDKVLKNKSRFLNVEFFDILNQIGDAIDYLHSKRIIHKDIKPGNILLTNNNEVKLLDFGLFQELMTTRFTKNEYSGTPRYMSPEQEKGGTITPKSDIFSFGLVLKELLGYQFKEKNGYPLEIQNYFSIILSENPRRRPSSAGEILNTITKLIEEKTC